MVFTAKVEQLPHVTSYINGLLKTIRCTPKIRLCIDTAVEEIFVNIANYAYGQSGGHVTVQAEATPHLVTITFMDSGVPYDPLSNPEPDITLPAEKRSIGGLGIFMAKKLMDELVYTHKDGQNILTMKKYL